MADTKISGLSAATALGATDLLPVVQGGATKKATIAQLQVAAEPATQYDQPATGATVTIASGVKTEIIDPAGTIATLTVNMPTTPPDGWPVRLLTSQIVTALTMSGGAATIAAPLTATTANGNAEWVYHAGNATWYRSA